MYNKVIVFEGIDGSGKSFHLNAASNYLKKKKIKHIKLREPGGSKNSEKLRKLLLSNKSDFEKKTDLLIYLSARSENFHKIIQPNLKKKVILIDRFVDSTIAYQHYGFGINRNIINSLNRFMKKDSIKHFPANGEATLSGVIVDCDVKTGLAKKVNSYIFGGHLNNN